MLQRTISETHDRLRHDGFDQRTETQTKVDDLGSRTGSTRNQEFVLNIAKTTDPQSWIVVPEDFDAVLVIRQRLGKADHDFVFVRVTERDQARGDLQIVRGSKYAVFAWTRDANAIERIGVDLLILVEAERQNARGAIANRAIDDQVTIVGLDAD
ncbi:hypothetical protein GCM10023156_12510 [Novipirellula rosea]|uniref:Uncharacterized protein n=1 Tax=Novipirellula rosea TaxID=1031540 RepID=A0ABP8MFQ7_9BACT